MKKIFLLCFLCLFLGACNIDLKNKEQINNKIKQEKKNDEFLVKDKYGYAKDKDNVYWQGKKISGNARDFVFLDYAYAHDDLNIYFQGKKIDNQEVNVFHFLPLNEKYAIDGKRVFYLGKEIHNIDYSSFEVIDVKDKNINVYVKDKNNVYFNGQIIKNAEPKSFKFLGFLDGFYYSKDDKNYFANDLIVYEEELKKQAKTRKFVQ